MNAMKVQEFLGEAKYCATLAPVARIIALSSMDVF
jgi:hypothetical protein